MSDIAIRVENLSKQYRIGAQRKGYRTFREALINSAKAPLRRLRGVKKVDETIWALNDVSFEVNHGEAIGVIGRNGAGKTTLLKLLSRITKPTKGSIDLYGRVASLLEVGTGFHPELTGRDNIFLNGAILGMNRKEIDRKFDEMVDFSGVEKFLDTPVKRYSSGMYVRLAFAVAAHLEPEILMVDEVLAVGDAEFQKKCLKKMDDVAHEGRTVIFVSHNMGAVADLCTRAILLEGGQLLMDDSINEVVATYLKTGLHQDSFWQRDERMPVTNDKKHYLESLKIMNEKKEPSNSFLFGENITLGCNIVSQVEEQIFLGIGIRDSSSRQIIHFSNKDHNSPLQAKTGSNWFNVSFENILNKGDYYVTIWVSDSHFTGQDYIKNCISFSSDTINLGNNYYRGLVITSANWEPGI